MVNLPVNAEYPGLRPCEEVKVTNREGTNPKEPIVIETTFDDGSGDVMVED